MELLRLCFFIVLVLGVDFQCSESHSLSRREANPDVNYDDVMADAAGDDTQNDADLGDDDEEPETVVLAEIESRGEDFVVNFGQTVRLPCKVNPQDDSVVIQWKKNENLYFLGSIRTNAPAKVTLDNTDLIIRDVDESDTGRYRCQIAGNNVAIEHTLSVQAPARITELSATQNGLVVEGTDVLITCKVTGNPSPSLIWSKETNSGVNIRLTEKDAEFSEHSLFIKKITREQSGKYICYADNKIGARPDAKHISIKVIGGPRVHIHKTIINSMTGISAVLQCSAHEEPEAEIRWLKDGTRIEDVIRKYVVSTDRQRSNLTVTPQGDDDFGVYTCEAENQYGTHSRSVKLVQEPVVENLDGDGPKLSWTVHSHLPLKELTIELRGISNDSLSEWRTVTVPVPSEQNRVYHVTYELNSKDLNPGKYEAHVKAKNTYDWSGGSERAIAEIDSRPEPIQHASVFRGNGATSIRPTTILTSTVAMYLISRFI